MLAFWVSERAGVVVVSCLERALSESDVGFFFPVVFSRDSLRARSRQDTTTTPALSETQNASMPLNLANIFGT